MAGERSQQASRDQTWDTGTESEGIPDFDQVTLDGVVFKGMEKVWERGARMLPPFSF